jgi:hypothetical protein
MGGRQFRKRAPGARRRAAGRRRPRSRRRGSDAVRGTGKVMAEGMTEEEKWHFDLHGWVSISYHRPISPASVSAFTGFVRLVT